MADVVDIASEVQEAYTAAALLAVPVYAGESAKDCGRCGEDIPEARREAVRGCAFCVDCQALTERFING